VRFALVGYGKMGRAIEATARERGHDLVAIVDPAGGGRRVRKRLDERTVAGAEVAFEFTKPATAESNVIRLLDAGVAVVCGTTGWTPGSADLRKAVRRSKAGAIVAPNFSLGMNLFYLAVAEAARTLGRVGLYDAFVIESHHRGKLDAPSGTAARLASIVQEEAPDYSTVQFGCPAEGAVSPGSIHVASVRAGHEPGVHTVGFDGPHDQISLTHRGRGRGGLALGAVVAGEWIVKRRGLHGFDRVLKDFLGKGGRR
jgi:4-hydroxy-tetrahydrodipicolinate reductase